MASYLRPRRGKKSTAESQNLVLKRGEVFFECPDTGVGTGKGKLKVGDGSTGYASLPYFMENFDLDADTSVIGFTDSSTETAASNNATYLSNIKPASSLKTIFTNLKQLLYNYNAEITKLNNDCYLTMPEMRTQSDRYIRIRTGTEYEQRSTLEGIVYDNDDTFGIHGLFTDGNTTNEQGTVDFKHIVGIDCKPIDKCFYAVGTYNNVNHISRIVVDNWVFKDINSSINRSIFVDEAGVQCLYHNSAHEVIIVGNMQFRRDVTNPEYIISNLPFTFCNLEYCIAAISLGNDTYSSCVLQLDNNNILIATTPYGANVANYWLTFNMHGFIYYQGEEW